MTSSDTTNHGPAAPTPRLDLVVTDAPTPADTAVISAALDRFNIDMTGVDDRRPLAVLVRDPETRRVIGGLSGRTSLGLFFVDLFFLPPELRGGGMGAEILRRAEHEARTRGCRAGVLYTISFQAPDFYRKQGWEHLGEVPCDPPGAGRVFMTKALTARNDDGVSSGNAGNAGNARAAGAAGAAGNAKERGEHRPTRH